MPRGRSKKEYKVWQQESPFREILWDAAQKSCEKDFLAIRDSRWEEFKKECRVKGKSSEWALEKIREAYEKVAKEEIGRLGTVQWKARSHLDVHLPALQQFPLVGLFVRVSTAKKHCSWWCATNRILVVQLGTNEDEAKFLGRKRSRARTS